MSKKKNAPDSDPITPQEEECTVEETTAQDAAEQTENPIPGEPQAEETPAPEEPQAEETGALQKKLAEKEDQYLHLAAEYDNFRRRSQKEKTDTYAKAKADAALAFLPVFDNLQRALAAPCSDSAYAKGVEMTMTQLKTVLEGLGITEIDALGKPFDPNLHNAVMHVEDDSVGESTVVEVFQSGFMLGEKVIRFAMVKVAN